MRRSKRELRADKSADDARASESAARQSEYRAMENLSKAKYESYVSGVGLAKARIDRNEFTEARRLIEELIAQRDSDAVPWELRYLSSLANQSTASLATATEVVGLAIAGRPSQPGIGTPAIVRLDDGTLSAITVAAAADPPIVVDTPRPMGLPDGEHASCIAIAEDGKRGAAGTENGDILLFDPQSLGAATSPSGLKFQRLVGHQGPVTAIQMIDEDYLVSASDDRTVRIWNLNNLDDEKVLWHIAPVVDIACGPAPDGFRIVAGVAEKRLGQVVVWDVQTGEELHSERRGVFAEHTSPVTRVAISPDARIAASGDVDGNVMLWPIAELQQRDVESLVKKAVEVASQSEPGDDSRTTRRTGDDAASMSFTRLSNPEIDADDFAEVSEVAPAHRSNVRSISFSADGQTLLTSGDDYLIHLWQIEPADSSATLPSDRLLRTLRGHGGAVSDAAFLSSDGQQVVSVGEDDSIRLWRSGVELAPGDASVLIGQDASLKLAEAAISSVNAGGFCAGLLVHDPILTHVHDDSISSAVLSVDGQRVVTASRDRTARVLTIDPTTLRLKTTAEMAIGEVPTSATDPSRSEQTPLVSLDEGSEFRAMSMRVNRSANKLFIGGADAVVRIWDLGRGTELGTLSGTGLNQVLSLSADSRVILTGSSSPETRVILWRFDPETSTATAEHRLAGHEEAVTAAAITADAKRALTADRAGRIIVWNVETGAAVGEPIDLLLGTRINDLALTPDGDSVWIAADDERLTRLDLGSREIVDRLDHDGIVTSVRLSGDGQRAVTSSELQKVDATVHHAVFWRLPTSDQSAAYQTLVTQNVKADELTRSGGRPGIASVSIDESGHHALVAINPPGEAPSRVERWRADADLGHASKEVALGLPERLGDVSAAIPLGGDELITLHGNSAYRWNTASRSLEVSYRIHGAISVAAVSPDGEIVLTGSRSVKAWDSHTGVAIGKLESPHAGAVRSIAFVGEAAPHEFFTGGDDGSIRRWAFHRDAGSFEPLETLTSQNAGHEGDAGTALSLSISPDGRELLATTNRGHVILYDLVGGTQQVLLSDPDIGSVFAGCFSPDGRFVAAAGSDKLARMWDLSKPREPGDPPDAVLKGHAEAISGVAMIGAAATVDQPLRPSEDAEAPSSSTTSQSTLRLFTASEDRSVRVWDPRFEQTPMTLDEGTARNQIERTGRELLELVRHRGGVTAIDFNSSGTLMVTAGRDGNVILWPACDP